MKITNLLRSIKIMQFEKMYDNWSDGRITGEEAAELLGMSSRNFRRWCRAYEEKGAEGLADKRLEKLSNRADLLMRLLKR
ncbi:MAG: helix-turn-helix domain-containing protein [Rickettsiaceae bacterium]|nr:helix-turn-helix domain-containing protein [Rickettsiaceae bacterium]